MNSRIILVVAVVAGILLTLMPVGSEPSDLQEATVDPLAPFERFMGAQWHLEGSYIEFEWGLGRRSVRSRGYFVVDGEPKLVSEGSWFWHPGEREIKGVFTAIDMPVGFFDYTTRFEENRMESNLTTYDAAGSSTSYVETWEFTDETHYLWRLLEKGPEGLREVMSGTYSQRR